MRNLKNMTMLALVLLLGLDGLVAGQMAGPQTPEGPQVPVPQVPVPQVPSMTCMSTFFGALVQLIPCRAAVAPFSPIPPSEACCNSVKALGQPCLCVLVNGPPISGVDRNMALMLPQKCTTNFEPCQAI